MSPVRLDRAVPLLTAAWVAVAGTETPVWAQEKAPPEERRQEPSPSPRSGCTLILEPTPTTIGNRVLSGNALVYHLGGGMLWRCGNAVMEADSAIRFEAERRVEMLGNVRYRDTIRTLESGFLTYYELPDSVVATVDVLLTRLASGSTVRGPRAEFLRALSGREALTTASGRPHITLYTDRERQKPPFEVDADRTVMAGEEAATAWGDVVIRRPDLTATADSVFFDIAGGGGFLYGEPRVEGEGFELTGDSIRLRFEESDLREVWALGRGTARGESYDVEADQIRARIRNEIADAVWAFGPGGASAVSAAYRLHGDSLRFVLSEGQIDSVVAVGSARAVEVDAAAAGDSPVVGPAPDTSVAVADSLAAMAAPDTTVAAADSLAAVAAPDTAAAPPRAPVVPDSLAGRDTLAAGPRAPGVGEVREAGVLPSGSGTGEGNWMMGDTLYAVFEARPEPSSGDSAAARQIRLLRVVGVESEARALYAAVVDSTRTRQPSRNYIIGRSIEILFQGGEVHSVKGEKAIGVYLDPVQEGEESVPRPPARGGVRDTTSARGSRGR
ncbi:MAG: hypothetical protein ACE5HP_00680 [Gemmatimonadota bacterium]